VKKIPLLIALGIFLLLAAIIFIYDFRSERQRSPWELIGRNVVLVYSPSDYSNRLAQQASQRVAKSFPLKDSSTQDVVNQMLTTKSALISLQLTAKQNFDFTFYVPLSSTQDKKLLSTFQTLLSSKKIEQRQRTFIGATIYEVVLPEKRTFSYTIIEDVLVASTTSFLVEDAVRISTEENPITFRKENSKLFRLSTSEKDDGDLYINLPEFFRWTRSFSDRDFLDLDFPFGKSLLTDLTIDQENATFNGFATDSTESENSFLSLFNKQTPVAFEMKSVIPTNSSGVFHYGIPQPEVWYKNREVFLKNHKASINDSLTKLSAHKFSPSEFFKFIDNEVGLITINNRSTANSAFIAELKNVDAAMTALDKLSTTLSIQNKDSIYSEPYSTYTIKKIDLPNFINTLFWPLASKSSETYFALVGKYVLFSESDELLKGILDDNDEDNTWSKSLRWNTFLQTTLQESNIDFFFDIGLLTTYLNDHLTPEWKSALESSQFLSVDRGAIQFSKLEQDFYFAGNFPLRKTAGIKKAATSFSNLRLENEITSSPFLVKNHNTGNSEIIVQDTLNAIYLIGNNGKIEWKLNLDSKIADAVTQIDYYKNGKLQYYLITKNKIHIIDRLGRYIPGYPKSIETRNLRFTSVVDYDKSKNYRFLISDDEKRIYIISKEGNQLEGWNPKRIQRNLFAPSRHYRILGKDYFIAIQDDGLVYIMNRRGEMINGFPLSLKSRPQGDYFFEGGKNFASSIFQVISQEGMKIRFNLLGKIVDQEALIKSTPKSHFYLVATDDRKASSFVRIDEGKIAVFDQEGRLLFEKQNPGSESLLPHMFNFDSGKRMYSFTDPIQDLSYVWDERGNSVLASPLETGHIPAMNYNRQNGELKIFWTTNNSITSTSIRGSN